MIESLHIENFRCFKSLELHGLKRVNVVVGANASGKTVLLEGIKLGLGAGPAVWGFLNQLRGFQPILIPNPVPDLFRSYFVDLFHNFDDQNPITISTVDSNNRSSNVRIYFDPKHAVTTQQAQAVPSPVGFQPSTPETAGGPAVSTIIPLAFDRRGFGGDTSKLYATVQNGQILLQPGPELGVTSAYFSSAYSTNPAENATWWSKLSVEKRSERVLSIIQSHFRFVRDLSSENFLPGVTAVYVDIAALDRKLPATYVSWGFNRLLTFILAIAMVRKGVIMIDEVENGIYHDRYVGVWETLFDLAKQQDTQLFVSTHSIECLKAALPTVNKHEQDFTLLRTDRINGTCGVTPIAGNMFESALQHGFDVR